MLRNPFGQGCLPKENNCPEGDIGTFSFSPLSLQNEWDKRNCELNMFVYLGQIKDGEQVKNCSWQHMGDLNSN